MTNHLEKQIKLKKINSNKHLQNNLSIIYYIGLWPDRVKYKYLYNLYTICSLIFLVGIIIVSEIIYIIINWGKIEIMMTGLTILMTNSTYAAKVIYIICRYERIKNLVDITNSEIFNRDNDKYKHIISYYNWQGIFHHIAYQGFASICIFSYSCIPLQSAFSGKSKQLPIAGWYPYNVTSTPIFEIACLHQVLVILINCINNIAIDTLITGFIIITCCQLTILSYNISSIHYTVESVESSILIEKCIARNNNINIEKSPSKIYNKFYENLKHCVKHSIIIFDFTKQIQDIFGIIIFFQLFVNCIIVCLAAFNLSQVNFAY